MPKTIFEARGETIGSQKTCELEYFSFEQLFSWKKFRRKFEFMKLIACLTAPWLHVSSMTEKQLK